MRKWGLAAMAALAATLFACTAMAVDLTANGQREWDAYLAIGGTHTLNDGEREFSNTNAGDLFANMMGSAITIQREFRRALPSIYSYSQTAHYQNRNDTAAVSYRSVATADGGHVVCPTTMCSPGDRWVMWDVPFYLKDVQKNADGYRGYENNASGFATGISRMLGDAGAIGLAAGYDSRKQKGRDEYYMKNRADTLHLALYGGVGIGRFFLDGYAGYSHSWNRSERQLSGDTGEGPFRDRLKGNFGDSVWSAGVKASYVWILGNDVRITPSAGVDFSHERMSGFGERSKTDGALINRIHKSTYSNVAIPLMVSVNRTFGSSWLAFGGARSLWTPEVRAGYIPVVGARRAGARMSSPTAEHGSYAWTARSSEFARSQGTVGGGLKIKLRDKYIFAVDYDYTFADNYRNHSFTAMYGVSF